MKSQIVKFRYKNKDILVKAKVCKKISEKTFGKMFTLNKEPLLFVFSGEQEVSIHMLFVFMPLLVIWIDKNKKIVKIKKMNPFISFSSARAKYVLEIPITKRFKI